MRAAVIGAVLALSTGAVAATAAGAPGQRVAAAAPGRSAPPRAALDGCARTGRWPEAIQASRAAAEAARAGRDPAGELQALDCLLYAQLQRGDDAEARRVLGDGRKLAAETVLRADEPTRNAAALWIAVLEARYALERNQWAEAAGMEPLSIGFPYADAHVAFARAVGAARSGNAVKARPELDRLVALQEQLARADQRAWAEQVEILRRIAAGWLARAQGKKDEGAALLRSAAELEESGAPPSAAPVPILPAREQLADVLLDNWEPGPALSEYEASLRSAPARFRSLYGAAVAAQGVARHALSETYFRKLLAVASPRSGRVELTEARATLARR
jgi:hypothetical protein